MAIASGLSRSALAFRLLSPQVVAPRASKFPGSIQVSAVIFVGLSTTRRNCSFVSMQSSLDTPPLIDVDCNLMHIDLQRFRIDSLANDKSLATPLDILLQDAVQEQNIVGILSPSSTIEEAKASAHVLQQVPLDTLVIRSTVGVHPYHINDDNLRDKSLEQHMEIAKDLLRSKPVLFTAVGECGLDASEGFPPVASQIPWFQAQIEIAEELQLPLFVHERLAFDATMDLLQDVNVPIIIHCFTGSSGELQAYIKRGYSVSISGFIFKEEAAGICECLRDGVVPLDKLMIETDAPYMGFAGCRDRFVAKNDAFVQTLNSKKRKRLLNSTYPNVPSSLPAIFMKVLEEMNTGRTERGCASLSGYEMALHLNRNANGFFKFGLDM